jgi:hypothetical protein
MFVRRPGTDRSDLIQVSSNLEFALGLLGWAVEAAVTVWITGESEVGPASFPGCDV